MTRVTEQQVLEQLKTICLPLPDTIEKVTYGHPGFATKKGIYAVLEEYSGELSLCVKVGLATQGIFLNDARFYLTPYIGNRGWISLKIHAAPLDWEEIAELVSGSHQLINAGSPKKAAKKRKAAAKK